MEEGSAWNSSLYLKAQIWGCDVCIQGKHTYIVWPFISPHVDHHWTFHIFQILQRLSWFSRPTTSILSTITCYPTSFQSSICFFTMACFWMICMLLLYFSHLQQKLMGNKKVALLSNLAPNSLINSALIQTQILISVNYTQPPSLLSMILVLILMRPCRAQDQWDGALVQWGSEDGTSNQPGSRGSGKSWGSYLPRFVFSDCPHWQMETQWLAASIHHTIYSWPVQTTHQSLFEEMSSSVKRLRIMLGLWSELVSGITPWAHSDLIGSSLMYRAKTWENLWIVKNGLGLGVM